MPLDARGRALITFAIESEQDRKYLRYVWVQVRKRRDRHHKLVGETVKQIAARYGHPEDAWLIAEMNRIGSITKHLTRKQVKIPGKARPSGRFQVLAGSEPPKVTDGYAKFSTLDRPARAGLTKFDGYSPVIMAIPVTFEAWVESRGGTRDEGSGLESDIALLERMAGRGQFKGSAVGPPAVVHISTTDAAGTPIPLIPLNFQRYSQNPQGPLWRITAIEWGDGALRDKKGRRIRQEATVTVQQATQILDAPSSKSASDRARSRHGVAGKGSAPNRRQGSAHIL